MDVPRLNGGEAERSLLEMDAETFTRIKTDPFNFQPPPNPPSPPILGPTMSIPRKLVAIQRYISAFEYNFTGRTFVSLRRDKGMKHLVFTAKVIMRECLPIQCVEALFLGVHLTNGIEELLRIPISFRSTCEGEDCHHIVLGVRHKARWGALGISRLKQLMYKPLLYKSLSDLIEEFHHSYAGYYHTMVDVSLGLPFSHNMISETPLQWKLMKLSVENNSVWQDYNNALLRFCKDCVYISSYFEATRSYPKWCDDDYRRGRKDF